MKDCPGCGKFLEEEMKYCYDCGQEQEEMPKGCKCKRGDWFEEVPEVCHAYEEDGSGDCRCCHPKECHPQEEREGS